MNTIVYTIVMYTRLAIVMVEVCIAGKCTKTKLLRTQTFLWVSNKKINIYLFSLIYLTNIFYKMLTFNI